jgi:hypothetical protein
LNQFEGPLPLPLEELERKKVLDLGLLLVDANCDIGEVKEDDATADGFSKPGDPAANSSARVRVSYDGGAS